MQVRSSASQHHAFCLRQHGTYRSSVCGFSRYARKNRTRLERSVPLCRRHNTPTA